MTNKYREYAVLINNRLIYYKESAKDVIFNREKLTINLQESKVAEVSEEHLVGIAEHIRSALRSQQGFVGVSVDIDVLEPDHERVVVIDIQPEHDIEIVVTPWNRFVKDFMNERSKCNSETN